jgi:hypothetical protein
VPEDHAATQSLDGRLWATRWPGTGTGTGGTVWGYYNPRTGIFNLRNRASKGRASEIVRFGPPPMIPLVGVWSGS